jgi:DNA-binding NarL/FixJ family response regulator
MVALLSDFDCVGEIHEAGDGEELLLLLGGIKTKSDLVLLDINMPNMDGVEATKQLKIRYPDVKIIILSMEEDTQLVSFMVNEGVNGYLLKNADPEELELAVKMVMKNDFYFSGSLSIALVSSLKDKNKAMEAINAIGMNSRELEIIKLICNELTAAEIGSKLSISARTVEGYKRNLLEKTGSRNIDGLVMFAIKNNLVKINS